jgi:hypothetical protein
MKNELEFLYKVLVIFILFFVGVFVFLLLFGSGEFSLRSIDAMGWVQILIGTVIAIYIYKRMKK